MSVYAISDLHLSLGIPDKTMDRFGGPWIDHVAHLKRNWEGLIKPEDTVLIPGDVSWALYLEDAMADLAFIDTLPGTKVISRGNHDLWWSSMKKMRDLFPSVKFVQNDVYQGEGFAVFGSRGWTCPGDKLFKEEERNIYDREIIRLGLAAQALEKLKAEKPDLHVIGTMHYPPTNEKKEPSGFTEIFERCGAETVIYGHLHGENVYPNGPSGIINGVRYLNVSLDRLNCMPIKIL